MSKGGSIPLNDQVCQRAGLSSPRSPAISASARSLTTSTYVTFSVLLDRYLQQALLVAGPLNYFSGKESFLRVDVLV